MKYETAARVFYFLVISGLVPSQAQLKNESLDSIDVPLLTKLDASLRASLDITVLNSQLISLIDKKGKVTKAIENDVAHAADNRSEVAQNEIIE